jgi:F0F1-type ATP synthase membrane subunit c/vacuolar-type H+-ATPase subunit K
MDTDLDLTGRRRDDPTPEYARRLRSVARICAALAGSVALFAVLSWFLTREAGGHPVPGLPPSVPLGLALLAAVLILLSSRLRSSILRRAFPRSAALEVNPDAVLAAYGRAALASFAILETAALLGLVISLTSGSAYYGIVLCSASAFGMLTRWPRAAEVDRLLRGRTRP